MTHLEDMKLLKDSQERKLVICGLESMKFNPRKGKLSHLMITSVLVISNKEV